MKKNKKHYSGMVNKLLPPALLALVFLSSAVFAADELSGVLTSINESFGLKSVFIKVLYLMEIYYGWHKWRQTGNPWSAAGIVIVAMFFTYAIPHWVVT